MENHEVNVVVSLQDHMTSPLRRIRQEQNRFRRDVEETKRRMDEAYENKKRMLMTSPATANLRMIMMMASSATARLNRMMEPLRQKIVTVVAFKEFGIEKIKKGFDKIRNWRKGAGDSSQGDSGSQDGSQGQNQGSQCCPCPNGRSDNCSDQNDSGGGGSSEKKGGFMGLVKAGIGSIGSKALGLGSKAVDELQKALKEGIKSATVLEEQMMALDRVMKVENTGKSMEEIEQMSKGYMEALKNSAYHSPFESENVINAGIQALGATEGDTEQAMNLVKIAQDMAAINPMEGLEGAMEALTALQQGDTDRIQAFGLDISAEDLKSKGINDIINDDVAKFFEGGTEKLGQTTNGLISTLKGKVADQFKEVGFNILEKIKPHLQAAVQLFDKFAPLVTDFGTILGEVVGFAAEKLLLFVEWISQYVPSIQEVIGNVWNWIGEKFGWLGEKTDFLREVMESGMSLIGTYLSNLWNIAGPIFDLLAASAMMIFEAFEWAWPGIEKIITTTWSIIEPIIKGLGEVVGFIADKVGKIGTWPGGRNKQRKFELSDPIYYADSGWIGRNASGTNNWRGGLTWVGENGPEIVNLPKGSQVIPNHKLGSAGKDIVININGVNKSNKEIINELVPELKLAMENVY